ncbi:hypothetical protein [Mucilaginibacter myungsuensis]|uniref:Uncharacterized protein n=1 Tax=Mucilaginibacter myungsuensis TaxID=649104 RepID=A0A929PYD5_9SPHI|nr:hypothetical protein [Mucilaginibacter myungsuensis]MBE9663335.1 hypothetical protein [Mucilaginibacter myungsuensis]MDN3600070.1 hypothetical protein [Mucilaginibacter myungsuensis]
MTKKVLAIYYTQSGQMTDIITQFTSPLVESGADVDIVSVKPVVDYNFPWTGSRFFSVMPDCQLGVPTELHDFQLKHDSYDLVILAYQPWFLSPSIPSNSIIQHPKFRAVVKDTPVVTISAGRNMWLNAFDKIKLLLADAGANFIGNVALVDTNPNFVSFVTIFYWMLTGKKERYLNIFPKPGVSDEDIARTSVYGGILAERLAQNNWDGLQQELVDAGAVKIKYPLMVIEGKAGIIFKVWANFIAKRKNKMPWITAFKYYLFIALFLGAPILLTLDAIFLRPFTQKGIRAKKQHYLLLN